MDKIITIELWARHFLRAPNGYQGNECPLGQAIKEQLKLNQLPAMGSWFITMPSRRMYGIHDSDEPPVINKSGDTVSKLRGYMEEDFMEDSNRDVYEDQLVRTLYLHLLPENLF